MKIAEDKITIRVNLVDRFYPLNIDKNEEEKVRMAAKRINDTVMEYKKKKYKDQDEQDFLAMAALYFATKAMENEKKYDYTQSLENLKDITQELEEYILKD